MSDTAIPDISSGGQLPDTAAMPPKPPSAGMAANNPAGTKTWLPEHDAHLRKCYAERMTGSEVAASLNYEFKTRYTRNAVIGRSHRLGVMSLNPPRPRIKANKAPRIRKYRPKELKHPRPVFQCDELTGLRQADVAPLHLSFLDLGAGQCRWPYGDGPFTFCGHPVLDGSYCFEHQSLSTHDRQARPERPDFARNILKSHFASSKIINLISDREESA